MTSRLVIRADGSVARGLGHVMRCVALAEAARERGMATTFVVTADATTEAALRERDEDVATTAAGDRGWLDALDGTSLLVIDGAHLADEVARGRDRGARVAVIDDAGAAHPEAHVVVSADLLGPAGADGGGPQRLLGPAHALVRREFRAHRRSCAPEPAEVLTLLGGTDPQNLLGAVTEALTARLPSTRVRAASGAVTEHGGQVASALAAAGAAVSAAGTAAWELLCLGVPAALLVAADDQHAPAALIDAAGAAVVLGPVEDALGRGLEGVEALIDPGERARLSEAGRALVDGLGADRVLDALAS